MIFHEVYSAYYNTVSRILAAAVTHPVHTDEIRQLIREYAFAESILSILPALQEERWQVMKQDGTTPIRHEPTLPLTIMQKRWLKAISLDPRMRLFGDCFPEYADVEPLFTPEDIYVFDRYADGDPYEDEAYAERFRVILKAIKERRPLRISLRNRNGHGSHLRVIPEYLEYSEKDDKFRLITSGNGYGKVINLARITDCKVYAEVHASPPVIRRKTEKKKLVFELTDERKTLERVMLHFAHFEKKAVRLEENRYRITVTYDVDDETELVIRVLSFGPFLKVVAPENFILLIQERLKMQKNCGF